MTGTKELDALDHSAPEVYSMPGLIVLTSAFKFTPFALMEYRSGASCEFVRGPLLLPPLLKGATVASVAATPSVRFETTGAKKFKDANPTAEPTAMRSPIGFTPSSAKTPDLEIRSDAGANFIPGSGPESQEMQYLSFVPAECAASPGRRRYTSGFRLELLLKV